MSKEDKEEFIKVCIGLSVIGLILTVGICFIYISTAISVLASLVMCICIWMYIGSLVRFVYSLCIHSSSDEANTNY